MVWLNWLWRCFEVCRTFFDGRGGAVWIFLGVQSCIVKELVILWFGVGLLLILDGVKFLKILVWWIVGEDAGRFL